MKKVMILAGLLALSGAALAAPDTGCLRDDAARGERGKRMAAMDAQLTERFNSADTDGDGKLSQAEAQAGMPRLGERFAVLDGDGDGFISASDVRGHAAAGMGRGGSDRKARLAEADSDGDGQLSQAEVEAAMPRLAERFDAVDSNDDGLLSRDEMQAFRAAKRSVGRTDCGGASKRD